MANLNLRTEVIIGESAEGHRTVSFLADSCYLDGVMLIVVKILTPGQAKEILTELQVNIQELINGG
jgi:hypothetical protein